MDTMATRLQALLQAKNGGNQSQFARVLGVTPQAVQKWVAGVTEPRGKNLDAAAKFFGVTPSYLKFGLEGGEAQVGSTAGGPSHSQPSFDENVRPAPAELRPIPVISSIQAGALRDMDNPYEPGDGYAVEYTSDTRLSRWAFGLDVEGHSMAPMFQPGDRLIVDPELTPNPGNFVIARNGSNQATFKKYRPRGIDASGNMVFELVPLNDDYPVMRSDTEKLTVLGVVVEHRHKLR